MVNSQPMKLTLSTVLVLLLGVAFTSTIAQAQWELLHDFGDAPASVRDLEFHHQFRLPHKGFLVRSEVCKTNPVVQSTDGGLSWYPTPLDANANTFGNNFAFLDANVGFLSMSGWSNGRACERTTDGGTTWHALPRTGSSEWVSVNRWKQHVFLSITQNQQRYLLRSVDKGLNWQQLDVSTRAEVTFTNANDGFAVDDQRYAYTVDGGASWRYREFPFIIQMFGIPNSTIWFAIAHDRQDGHEILYKSLDAGLTWTPFKLPASFRRIGNYGWMTHYFAWSGTKIFSQGYNRGVQQSADSGKTWSPLCGPRFIGHLYAFNDTVATFDYESRLWVNKTLQEGKTLPNRALWQGASGSRNCNPFANLGCPTRTHLMIWNRNACDPMILKRIEMVGAPYFYDLRSPTLPYTIDSFYHLEFEFEGITNELRTGKFRITYDVNGHEFDTVITYYAQSSNPISVTLNTDSVVDRLNSSCDTLRTAVQVELQLPCDSLLLIRSWLEDSSIFRITHSDFPNTRYSGPWTQYARVGLVATAEKGGVYKTKLHLQFRYRKVTFDTIVDLQLTVPNTTRPEITSYVADEVRSCRTLDSLVELTNRACDTLVIEEAALEGTSIFDLGSITLPAKLGPGQTLLIPFSYSLDTIGSFQSKLKLVMRLGADEVDTTVLLRTGIAPSAILSVKDLFVFEDICELRDTSILIANNLCDSIIVSQIEVLSGPVLILDALPTTILSVSTARIAVRFTSVKPGIEFARLRITYEVNGSTLDTVVVIRVSIQKDARITLEHAPKHDFGPVSTCTSDLVTIAVHNRGCEMIDLVSQAVSNSIDFTMLEPSQLPQSIPAGDSILLQIQFAPQQIGVKTSNLRMTFRNARGQEDAVVSLTGRGESAGPGVLRLHPEIVDFGTHAACQTDSMLVLVTNAGCDTVMLEPFTLTRDVGVTVDAQGFKGKLAPSEKLSLWIHFRPESLGVQATTMRIKSRSQSSSQWIESELPITALVTLPSAPITAVAPIFEEISECYQDSALLTVTNTGCTAQEVSASTVGMFLVEPNAIILQPGQVSAFTVLFDPQTEGVTNGKVSLSARDLKFDAVTQTWDEDLLGFATAGAKTLELSQAVLDFGETTICEERDTLITLTNKGCDTLVITDAKSSGHFIVGRDFPIVLPPGQFTTVTVSTSLDTTGNPSMLSGDLLFTSTADNILSPIQLSRTIIYPTKLRLEAIDESSGQSGDIVKFRIVLEGQVPSTMSALHFDLLHNNDLLEFTNLSSQDLAIRSTSGNSSQVQRFTLSPVREAGILGEISFKVFLAESTETTLSFDNITFEANGLSVAPECIAVIADSGSRFDYLYTCGDNTIRDRLNGPRLIKSIIPNPASDNFRIELAERVIEASVTLVSILGTEVLRTTDRLVDVTGLGNGTYYLTVTSNGESQTLPVRISR